MSSVNSELPIRLNSNSEGSLPIVDGEVNENKLSTVAKVVFGGITLGLLAYYGSVLKDSIITANLDNNLTDLGKSTNSFVFFGPENQPIFFPPQETCISLDIPSQFSNVSSSFFKDSFTTANLNNNWISLTNTINSSVFFNAQEPYSPLNTPSQPSETPLSLEETSFTNQYIMPSPEISNYGTDPQKFNFDFFQHHPEISNYGTDPQKFNFDFFQHHPLKGVKLEDLRTIFGGERNLSPITARNFYQYFAGRIQDWTTKELSKASTSLVPSIIKNSTAITACEARNTLRLYVRGRTSETAQQFAEWFEGEDKKTCKQLLDLKGAEKLVASVGKTNRHVDTTIKVLGYLGF